MAQMPKPTTPSTPTQISIQIPTSTTPNTTVHTHLLQKQLEQPLKMDNQNVTMHQGMQNQPQIQQFQVVQQKTPQNIQNVSLGLFFLLSGCF